MLQNRYNQGNQLLAVRVTPHSDVLLRPDVAVLPGPALARLVLEANPLNVVLRTKVNQEVR